MRYILFKYSSRPPSPWPVLADMAQMPSDEMIVTMLLRHFFNKNTTTFAVGNWAGVNNILLSETDLVNIHQFFHFSKD